MIKMLVRFLERFVAPFLLIATIPTTTVCIVHLVINYKSDLSVLLQVDPVSFIKESWTECGIGDQESWIVVIGLSLWGLASMTVFGGKRFEGPSTSNGFIPEYRHNAFRYYVITLVISSIAFYFDVVPAFYWYKKLVPLTGCLITFFMGVSVLLYIKGIVTPSPGEYGSSGNPVFDYYWGLELYPRLGRWFDIKLFCVSRFGIMAWLLLVLVTWKAQIEFRGFSWAMTASSILQIVYIGKYYWWEDGYCKTIDIMVDRAGFYLCFGAGGFMPEFFILNNSYQVENETHLTLNEFLIVTGFGLGMILLTYWVDYQRLVARETNGRCLIWGKKAKVINAKYLDSKGKEKINVLLASGFWGWTHHPNYFVELLADLAMVLPVKSMNLIPYTYVIFLIILIIHRSFRDEKKCREKYGRYWQDYCKISKYKLIPFVF